MKFRPLFCLLLVTITACAPQRPPVPVGVVPEPAPLNSADEQYGHQMLAQLSQRYQLDFDHPRGPSVEKIVARLTAAANADKDPWHVYVFKDPGFKNAAAARGNHVFIWTGMLDATRNDDELATVLAHEIGHVLSRHTDPDPNEELKKVLVGVSAVVVGTVAAGVTRSPTLGQTAGDIASVLTQEVGNSMLVYPYSREREAEADQVGLFLMADAKYNPQAAIDFWGRAENDPSFGSALAFFSTHPPADERLARLRAILPRALERYQGIASRPTLPFFPSGSGQMQSQRAPLPPQPLPVPQGNFSGGPVAQTPMPTGDSFDVGESPGTTSSPEVKVSSTWVVTADRAQLHEEPSSKSRALGEFKRGARVRVVQTKNGWIEIETPDHGFLRRNEVAPE